MTTTYFGFAVADGMFSDGMSMTRRVINIETVRELVEKGVTPILNPSHVATIDAMRQRYDLNVAVPEKAPMVKLDYGDKVVVMSVRGLPRREGPEAHYTAEEVAAATFEFSLWEVSALRPGSDAHEIFIDLQSAFTLSDYFPWKPSAGAWAAAQRLDMGETIIVKPVPMQEVVDLDLLEQAVTAAGSIPEDLQRFLTELRSGALQIVRPA